jgi:hypothetical protein
MTNGSRPIIGLLLRFRGSGNDLKGDRDSTTSEIYRGFQSEVDISEPYRIDRDVLYGSDLR